MSDQRICIKCLNVMVPQMVQEVEVDICPKCGGMWLDREEIRELASKSDQELSSLRGKLERLSPSRPVSDGETEVPCPACGGKLMVANLGPVFIEHCSACDGVYLDKGELDRTLEIMKLKGHDIATIVALARWVVTQGSIGS